MEGGFYFHPSDEDLSSGTPERKKPPERVLSVYSNSENAIGGPLYVCGTFPFSLTALPVRRCPRGFFARNSARKDE